MPQIGSDTHLALLAVAFIGELAVVAYHYAFSPHHSRVSHRKLRAVGARRSPATGALSGALSPVAGTQTFNLRVVSRTAPAAPGGGSVASSCDVEPGGAAERTSSEQPPPAPGPCPVTRPGAGLNLQTAANASRSALYTLASSPGGGLGQHRVTTAPPPRPAQPLPDGGGPVLSPGSSLSVEWSTHQEYAAAVRAHKRPVTVGTPDSAVAGLPLPAGAQPAWETAGAADPEKAAPALGVA